ncbi:hypothetical protein BgiMline_020419 [Biomphalaria glabrata]|nr:hypothetical protein BgiMline_017621 [Biomphalaria glabrata]KAI8779108.1 hypothetical protein BgiBS90_020090 [Biomphalaria glabrata]
MFSVKINTVFSCLIGLIYGHVDSFMASPDVDTKAGFFPDSGFLKSSTHQETFVPGAVYTPHHHPSPAPSYNTEYSGNNINSFYQRSSIDTLISPADLLAKRLQRLMATMSNRKANKVLPLSSHVEDPGFLHLFTGAKDNKG